MLELLRAIKDIDHSHHRAFTEQGVREGLFTQEVVDQFFAVPDKEVVAPSRARRAPLETRRKRLSQRRCHFAGYVRRFSIDILRHPGLSTGAVTTLIYLISRCGRRKQVTLCTNWVAKDLGVHTRTIQNHYRQIEQAGFVVRSSPDARGRTTIYLTPHVEVRSYKSNDPQTLTTYGDGAKKIAHNDEMDSKKEEGDGAKSAQEPRAACWKAPPKALAIGRYRPPAKHFGSVSTDKTPKIPSSVSKSPERTALDDHLNRLLLSLKFGNHHNHDRSDDLACVRRS